MNHIVKCFSICVMAAIIMLPAGAFAQSKGYPSILFLGAAQSIGGSAILVETEKTRFLIDYGLHYGDQAKNAQLVENPAKLDFVLLTHAHIDHSGRLPMLYKNGFKGPVVATDATQDIAGRMLDMSLGIGETQGLKLFDRVDLNAMMASFKAVGYGQVVTLSPDVEVRFNEAGHIMGSAIIEIWIKKGDQKLKIVAGGDMGGQGVPIIRDRAQVTDADYVIVESTYGDKAKGPPDYKSFEKDVASTLKSGGSVLIPAFVLEKTQKVIAILCDMKRRGAIPASTPIYSDSSTAKDITAIYRSYKKYYDSEAEALLAKAQDPLSCEGLREVSNKEALATHEGNTPAIYISSSGMLEHAGSPKHLNAMIADKRNLLAIVGWQAPGTPGRKLQEGAKEIDIPIETWKGGKPETTYVTKPVTMKVKRYDGFSSHADGCEMLEWLAGFKKLGKVFVVHGEKNTAVTLASRIKKYLGVPAEAPALGYTETLRFGAPANAVKPSPALCEGMGRDTAQAGYTDQ